MPQITSLTATTELEAVNAMLSSIGEAPIANVDTATQADVVMAVNILRNTTRQVQRVGWRFNTEFGYEVAPHDTYDWLDSAGVTTPLNIYTPPAGLARFEITKAVEQQGARYVDTAVRPSKKWEAGTPVFYDREFNRDGFPQADRDYLYINPVWWMGFEDMPEIARFYVVAKASRDFTQHAVGSAELSGFTADNVRIAYRDLKREEGLIDDYNIFRQHEMISALGGRRRGPTGVIDPRSTAGPVPAPSVFYSQWYEDFGAYTVDVVPPVLNWPEHYASGLLKIKADAGAVAGKVLRYDGSGGYNYALCKRPGVAVGDVPLCLNQRVVALMQATLNNAWSGTIVLRAKPAYAPDFNLATSIRISLQLGRVDVIRVVGGLADVTIGQANNPISGSLLQPHLVKAEITSPENIVRVKVWLASATEPSSWLLQIPFVGVADGSGFNSATSPSRFGFGVGTVLNSSQVKLDVFSADTN
jgi:Autographiviridae tail tubular protein Gp11